jgi:hypothetical protein
LRLAALRARAGRALFLPVFRAAFVAVFLAAFFPPDLFAVAFRAVFRLVLLRAAAFFAPPPFRADLPVDFRAFATF